MVKISNFSDDKTIAFSISKNVQSSIKCAVCETYDALNEKGYRAVTQLVGYLISEDPVYITTHNDSRKKITKFKREEILEELVKAYVSGQSE